MKGTISLIMVILSVFTVSLTASPILGNTVNEVLETSPLKKEDSPFTRVLSYDHIAILNVGVKKTYKYNIAKSKQSLLIEKTDTRLYKNSKRFTGGGRRIKSGRH